MGTLKFTKTWDANTHAHHQKLISLRRMQLQHRFKTGAYARQKFGSEHDLACFSCWFETKIYILF